MNAQEEQPMNPRPAKDVPKSKGWLAHPIDPFQGHKDMAYDLMTIIAMWSWIDSRLGRLLATLMKSDIRAAVAIFNVPFSANTRKDMLLKAAGVVLANDSAGLRLIVDTLAEIEKNRGRIRNPIAHGIWAVTANQNDFVVHVESGMHAQFHAHEMEANKTRSTRKAAQLRKQFDAMSANSARVWTKSDISAAIAITHSMLNLIELLGECFGRSKVAQKRQILRALLPIPKKGQPPSSPPRKPRAAPGK